MPFSLREHQRDEFDYVEQGSITLQSMRLTFMHCPNMLFLVFPSSLRGLKILVRV